MKTIEDVLLKISYLALNQALSDLVFPFLSNRTAEDTKAQVQSLELLVTAIHHRMTMQEGTKRDYAEHLEDASFPLSEEKLEWLRIPGVFSYMGHTTNNYRAGETEILPFLPKAHARHLEVLHERSSCNGQKAFVEPEFSYYLDLASVPNVQSEPRSWLARLVLPGARGVPVMIVGSTAWLGTVVFISLLFEYHRRNRGISHQM